MIERMTEYRAAFDADVTFRNGGGLQVQGFRLDVPDPKMTEERLAELFVRHLGLLMVDRVRLSEVEVVAEPHRGSRGGPTDQATRAPADQATRGPADQATRGLADQATRGLAGTRGPVERAAAIGPHRLVELSHVISEGMTTYPGLPGPEITPHLTRADSRSLYAPGTEFSIDRISMVGNTGTYLDSPYHRYPDGADLAGLPLSAVADLPTVTVRLTGSGERAVTPQALAAYDVSGAAVLLHTGWDRHWGTEAYGHDAPYLTGAAAQWLVAAGARLVGIDSVNIDNNSDGERPAHSILLAAGIPVLEHLTGLEQLPVTGARLHAAAPRLRDFGTFPVRAYALVPD
jgi:kynurenine formamidase